MLTTLLCAGLLLFGLKPVHAADEPQLSAADVSQPEGWDADMRMAEPVDINPDPHILEFNLEAKVTNLEIVPGKTTPAWTYNGTLPGPLIRAQVGDRLIVHFKNSLPEETTIHWHGLRLPNNMDGAPGLTQKPVPPGGTFEYSFVLRDAGTFWYHPHFDSAAQVARGLYGAIVVTDPKDPKAFGDDLVVMLSDIAINPDGTLMAADRGGAFGTLFGREGNYILVNGKIAPTVKVRAGKAQRWRVIDAAISRYFPIALRHNRWTRIGGDAGLMEHTEELPRMVVSASERADLVLIPSDAPGTENGLYWLPPNRGWGTSVGGSKILMIKVKTVDEPAVKPEPIPYHLRDIKPIDIAGATEKRVELTIDVKKPGKNMGINGVPDDFTIEAHAGETQVWTVVNNTIFDHPFHLHGFFFQVLDDSRTPEWKDTVNVPNHSTMRIAVKFDNRPGWWMFHCHILDHADAGMMAHLHVLGPEAAAHGATSGSSDSR